MFWECHVVTSSIDKLLDQPVDQVRLQDFLDEADLIQECLNQNQRLLDYLVQGNVMKELIEQIIQMPADGNFRNANVVSELLSGDFQRLQEVLLEKDQFDVLYSFLSNETTLNPILASYFARIVGALIVRRPSDLIEHLKSRATFKKDFLRHLDSTSIADLLFRFISESGEQRSTFIQWYEEINLIDDLMKEFRETESTSVQMNIGNLFNEFLRLAFDQQSTGEGDFPNPNLTATIERLLFGRSDASQDPFQTRRLSSNSDDEQKSKNNENDGKLTPVVLAEHILSKSNLEQFFDALIQRSSLVTVGCDFLDHLLEILSRQLPAPLCIPSKSSINESEQMQINDEEAHDSISKTNENGTNLNNPAKENLLRIYFNLIDIIPSRLPSLIILLSSPRVPLNSITTNKNNFQPLGPLRLNLIKFFSKLIQTISNDLTGEKIFEIFETHRLFHLLIDLFHRHIYNNFLHTQVFLILRLIIEMNSKAVEQVDQIWSRSSLNELSESDRSFHYTNRSSFKLFQSIFDRSKLNLFEYLFDQYEQHLLEKKSVNSDSKPFTSPNSGHVAQILRCLRDHSSTFDNYSVFFQSNQMEDESSNQLEKRWLNVLDHLVEEEKNWSAMHLHERHNTETFRIHPNGNSIGQNSNAKESYEASQRRQTFHTRSFGSSAAPRFDDDDDDDEVEQFNIDDELMNNEQTSNERKVANMKEISFQPQFPPVFDEQTLWFQEEKDQSNKTTIDHEDMKNSSAPTLPDLFQIHRKQEEKNHSSTESTFEQLCSLKSNENPSGSILYPLQSSSSILRDEVTSKNDPFWQQHPIYFNTSNAPTILQKQPLNSSSSEEHSDDEDSVKFDAVPSEEEKKSRLAPNNMMDIFRHQPTMDNNNKVHETSPNRTKKSDGPGKPISSSTPERTRRVQTLSSTAAPKDIHEDDEDDDDELVLQNNFSFLIAKGMLKPASS